MKTIYVMLLQASRAMDDRECTGSEVIGPRGSNKTQTMIRLELN